LFSAVCGVQVRPDHWEPIAHGGVCVLRKWDSAVRVARMAAKTTQLVPNEVAADSLYTFAANPMGDPL
jgi:hypothetical protein